MNIVLLPASFMSLLIWNVYEENDEETYILKIANKSLIL